MEMLQQSERASTDESQACPICGGVGYYRADVPLGHPLWGKAIICPCRRTELERRRAEALRARSGLTDVQLSSWTFESFDPALSRPMNGQDQEALQQAVRDVKTTCQAYAGNPRGWLVLVGNVGSGKTHLAYAIAAEALRREVPVYVDTVPDMLGALRETFGNGGFEERFRWLREVRLLVLDDLGTEQATPWATEKLYQLVNARYMARLPMVVTSNVPLAKAGGRIEPRILSRLQEGARTERAWSRELVIPAGDYRPYAMSDLERTRMRPRKPEL